MLGAVPAVFTPGPPPAHMSSPGRPVAPRRPPPSALPAAGAGRAGTEQNNQAAGEPLPAAPVRLPEHVAGAPAGVSSAAAGGTAEPAATELAPVSDADAVPEDGPLLPGSLPAVELPQAKAIGEAGSGSRDTLEPRSLPCQQQHPRQVAAFDPRAAAVPLGQAVTRPKQAAATTASADELDRRPRLQAAAGSVRPGSLHAPLLPARPDPDGKAPRGGPRKPAAPAAASDVPTAAARAPHAVAASQEHTKGVSAHELTEQAAAQVSAEAAKAADDGGRLVSRLPANDRQPASPRAEAPAEGITPASGAVEQREAAGAAIAPVALPPAATHAAISDTSTEGGPCGASPPFDGPGVAAALAQRALGSTDDITRLGDSLHDRHDGRSADSKRRREVAAGDSLPPLAEEERPLKRQDAAATSSAAGGAFDVAAAVSLLLQVGYLPPNIEPSVLGHTDTCLRNM